jgi:hypothetical protein
MGLMDLDWREPAGDGRTWRLATQDDLPELERCWREQSAALGEEQDMPQLLDNPVLLTLVLVDDEDRVLKGLYLENTVSVGTIGVGRDLTESIVAVQPYLHVFLKQRKIRVAYCAVPKRLTRLMEKLIAPLGMKKTSGRFDFFGYLVQR